ncbi:hypothetical protein LUZ61_003584 [Rhynchospora tenuis]|uniref:Protein kinase domain-containing protein n=1 Tax=Rhynchospora tenuis TaxID=198213 RepID=A0AAD6ESW9_9POAL|nr:hypothetical protein LUZ61_003584 [Rhynchospora tenuis]
MALSTILLPCSFFLSLLLLIAPSHCILGPTSTTLAISQATGTVCGITAGTQHHGIQCTSAGLNSSFPIDPTLSFDSITGGGNFICSLRSGDTSFFCWDGINQRIKRIYSGPTVLTELSVGGRHVAAIEEDQTKIQSIQWWRYGCHKHSQLCSLFPQSIVGVFHSLTSGDLFTCAINETHKVNCWGPQAESIMMRFAGVNMESVTAGGSRMCGLNMTGHLICSGDQFNVPPGEAFEFINIAIGSNHTCAIRRKNRTVVCWGLYGSYAPMGSTSFEFLVAGGDLTCGLMTDAFNVACWDLSGRSLSAVTLSLPQILPGVCIPDETFCSCGVYPDSADLCGGSGIICMRPDSCTTDSFEPPAAYSLTTREKFRKLWFVFVIAYTAAFIAGIAFLLVLKKLSWCRHKEGNLNGPGNPGMRPTANRFVQQRMPITPGIEDLEVFSFNDLMAATDRFSASAQLGRGSYGVRYMGRLSDGRQVAVMHLNISYGLRGRVFNTELSTSVRARHANVVNLIGYCRENDKHFCVFEIMQHDLHTCLFPVDLTMRSPLYSSWKLRVKVLLDTARGIKYLHQETNPPIIHRDIKSSNILIDENWVAKISGLGFALFGPEVGRLDVRAKLTGTNGYIDPEYRDTRRVTPRSDVYSFGVVMLEVLTGREAINRVTRMYLVDEVALTFGDGEGNILEVLDGRLPLPEGRQMEAIKMVAQIARRCVKETYTLRPIISSVVLQLERAFALFD